MALDIKPDMGRHITRHWLYQQLASIALIPLGLYALITFFAEVVMGDGRRESAVTWLSCPVNAVMLILLLAVGIFHGCNGLLGIIEDYVHHRILNRFSLLAVKTGGWVLALAGISSVLKIAFGH